LSASPRATVCLADRVELDELSDDCNALESDARMLLRIRRESREGRDGVANALAAKGAPLDSVRDALAPFDSAEGLRETVVPTLEGDFPEVERIATAALEAAEAKQDIDHMLTPAYRLVAAYTESGDLASAGRFGETLAGSLALCGHGCDGYAAAGISAKARGGRLGRAEANAQLLALYKEVAQRRGRSTAWHMVYGDVRSPEDAQAALSVYEHEGPPFDSASTDLSLAFAYALAGRSREARAIFSKVGGACSLAIQTHSTMTEHLVRGRLDEEAGDKPSACGHYATILAHWGHAKPRSVTADEARARSKALGCPQP
jgi:serine/threonine-protein kinase